jgi:hypothetical protein
MIIGRGSSFIELLLGVYLVQKNVGRVRRLLPHSLFFDTAIIKKTVIQGFRVNKFNGI